MTDPEKAQTYPKTHAKELYCLTEEDLEPLPCEEKKNPYRKTGTPMNLYKQPDVSPLPSCLGLQILNFSRHV